MVMEEIPEATRSYFSCTIEGPFDHQRDAYEQGWDDGADALRRRLREAIDEHRQYYWDGSLNGYVWFEQLYELVGTA